MPGNRPKHYGIPFNKPEATASFLAKWYFSFKAHYSQKDSVKDRAKLAEMRLTLLF